MTGRLIVAVVAVAGLVGAVAWCLWVATDPAWDAWQSGADQTAGHQPPKRSPWRS
jgi:hypothetical protein